MDPFGERCDHECGRRVVWHYRKNGQTLALCSVCSRVAEPALAAQGWKVAIPA